MAEGLKVIDALGIEYERIDYDLAASGTRDGTVLPKIIDEWRDRRLTPVRSAPTCRQAHRTRPVAQDASSSTSTSTTGRPGRAPTTAVSHDFVVIRENTEGTYAGEGGLLRQHPARDRHPGPVNTRMGVERCVRYAFDLAMKRKHVTLVHKTNVLPLGRSLSAPSTRSPPSTPRSDGVQPCRRRLHLLRAGPQRYDVIVTDNLFGDILTDLGGAVSGGIGLAPTANLNPNGMSMFEPVHGSAPDIVGTGKANPIAILSGAMMLDHLGESEEADRIREACTEPETRPNHQRDRRRDRRRPENHHQPPIALWAFSECSEGNDMPITPTPHIWMNGEMVPEDAKIHPPTRPLRHRRLRRHPCLRDRAGSGHPPADRAHRAPHNSAKILGMPMPYDVPTIVRPQGRRRRLRLDACYLRPIAYYGYGEMGLATGACTTDIAIAAAAGAYWATTPSPRACA